MRERTEMRPSASDSFLAGPSDSTKLSGLEGAAAAAARSPWQIAWRRFKRHKLAMIGAIVLLILILMSIFAPVIARHDVNANDIGNQLKAPSLSHPFGTDNIGRDQFARVLYGGRISLLIGISVAIGSGILGTVIGAIAGYYGRWVDQLLMRVTDLFLAIPLLVILIIAIRLLSGSIFDIVLILSLVFWMPNARIVRGVVLSLKEKEFVEASRSLGASNLRIVFSEILPNVVGPIIVIVTLNVAQAILTESALSFLNFGVDQSTPTWGNLLSNARNFTLIDPAMVWFPGLFILITVLAVNLMGDGLRDALDPHQVLRAEE